jgi:hypothetical protein
MTCTKYTYVAGPVVHSNALKVSIIEPQSKDSGLVLIIQARLYGAEYETGAGDASLGPLGASRHQRNVPCAVCATMARGMQLMVPARADCPDDSWVKEYSEYLMTDSDLSSAFHRTKFICVDREAEVVPNTATSWWCIAVPCQGCWMQEWNLALLCIWSSEGINSHVWSAASNGVDIIKDKDIFFKLMSAIYANFHGVLSNP